MRGLCEGFFDISCLILTFLHFRILCIHPFFPVTGNSVSRVLFPKQLCSTTESLGFPDGSDGKEPACSAGDPGSIPGSGRSPGEGNGNPLQYSCLENSIDRGGWWAAVLGVAKSRTWLVVFNNGVCVFGYLTAVCPHWIEVFRHCFSFCIVTSFKHLSQCLTHCTHQ